MGYAGGTRRRVRGRRRAGRTVQVQRLLAQRRARLRGEGGGTQRARDPRQAGVAAQAGARAALPGPAGGRAAEGGGAPRAQALGEGGAQPAAPVSCYPAAASTGTSRGDGVSPAARPRISNCIAILRDASSIISSPSITAPRRSTSVAWR